MKMALVLMLFAVQAGFGEPDEALGIPYEEVLVVRLKYPVQFKGKVTFAELERSKDRIDSTVRIRARYHARINRLFAVDADFGNGLTDIRLQLYCLVFLMEGKPVLVVSPNILGGDLNATDRLDDYDPRSLSENQRKEFLALCHLSLALARPEDLVDFPPRKSGSGKIKVR